MEYQSDWKVSFNPELRTLQALANYRMNRLLVWYTIATALFRCPSSSEEILDSSPQICRPYLRAREVVQPYLQPYYDRYGAPQIERARPYVDELNRQILSPSIKFGKESYEKYGASRVDLARNYSQEQWARIIKPQIDAAQSQAHDQYSSNVAPHVTKASEAAAPYYSAGVDSVSDAYNKHVSPKYANAKPLVMETYSTIRSLVVDVCLPYIQTAWRSTIFFFDRILWPRVRILYGENVEPQLVRIGERLASYRDGRKLKSVIDEMEESSTSSTAPSSTASVYASTTSSTETIVSSTTTSSAASTSSLSPEEEAQQTREKIETDLTNWQRKFAKAADTGAEDLKERVSEIADRQLKHSQGVGQALLVELEETFHAEETKLKNKAIAVTRSLTEEPSPEAITKAEEVWSKAVRKAGLAIKDKALGLRTWKSSFDAETHSLILSAANSTLEVIDSIRDLGLQEIGMRWAWMEGVTYKDWSKYHEVKKTFDQWRKQVLDVALKHSSLEETKSSVEALESNGIAIAEQAAKALSRLKEVGLWKIQAQDDSDDFDMKIMPAKAASAAQKVLNKASSASEEIMGTPQGTAESFISKAGQQASDAALAASAAVLGGEPVLVEKASSALSETASGLSEKISESVWGTPQPKTESVLSVAQEKAAEFASDASSKVIGTPQPKHESVHSVANDKAKEAVSDASSVVVGSEEPIYKSVGSAMSLTIESAASTVSEAMEESSSQISESISSLIDTGSSSASAAGSEATQKAQQQKVFGGAMAQEVPVQKPILDDEASEEDSKFSETVQSLFDQAGDKYEDIAKAVTEALKIPSPTKGNLEKASSMADEEFQDAFSAASSILFGTEKGATEQATSMAAEKWVEAMAA